MEFEAQTTIIDYIPLALFPATMLSAFFYMLWLDNEKINKDE